METQPLEQQIQSVERNIAFLKKEQLDLLHDLHLEILRLQKHCTELTQELESKRVEDFQQDQIELEMEEKCRILEARYSEKEKLNLHLKKELYHRENRVAALRSKLREKEKRFLEEVKRRSHRVTILNTELHKQTEAAAYLSFQLHTIKYKQQSKQHSNQVSSCPLDLSVVKQPKEKVKRRVHKNHSAWRAECSASKDIARDSFQREQITSYDELEPMPDPALFLYPKRYLQHHRQRPEPKSHTLEKSGKGHVGGAMALGSQWSEKLSSDNEDSPPSIPVVKAKLPKSERGKRRALARQDSRDSE
ncbi:PREDICTED: coiled-coil domain-containing protein 92 [Nanorana parkeri]|uniref:coiled-coil domain-containing protein 92 n=1 Tax=Nanorana parkeri TaxID=125878 RepID=UPI000854BA09|nr:PREDICTED: coiled-coil domain-containing protein 92 [Nanorana parkeri]